MVSTPELFTDDSPNVPMTLSPVKKPSASKSLCLFTNILDVKQKTAKRPIVAAKSKRRAMKVGTILCTKKTKRKGHSKINYQIKHNLYARITRHPQVVQSPISNDCLKVMLDDQIEPQLVPKLLLQVYVRELHNSLVSDTNYGGLKYSRDEDDNIIISDSTFFSLLSPQLKTFLHVTRSCVVVNVAFLLKLYINHCYPGVIGIWKKVKIKSKTIKSEGLVKDHITYMKHIKYRDATWASYL